MELFWFETGPVPLTELFVSLLIAAGGIFLAYLVSWVMRGLAEITRKSRFRFDGVIVRVTARPIAILIGTLIFLYAVRRIEQFDVFLTRFPNLDMAVIILIGAWMIGSLVRELLNVYLKPYVESTETDFDQRLLHLADLTVAYIIYLMGIVAALHTLGFQITAVIATLGVAGLAVALAVRAILSNFFGGIILTVDKYIQPGHRIKVGEWIGDVEQITLYKTTLRTRDNLLVSIPNDVLMHETTVNYFLPEALTRVELDLGIAYEADLDRATEIVQEIIENLDGVSGEREPEVNVIGFGDSSVDLKVLVWKNDPTGARKTRDKIYREVLKRFTEEGIEIPYPHLDLALRPS